MNGSSMKSSSRAGHVYLHAMKLMPAAIKEPPVKYARKNATASTLAQFSPRVDHATCAQRQQRPSALPLDPIFGNGIDEVIHLRVFEMAILLFASRAVKGWDVQFEHAVCCATDDSPECPSFHLRFALHPVHYLGAKDDFEILFTPVGASAFCQLFQVCRIG